MAQRNGIYRLLTHKSKFLRIMIILQHHKHLRNIHARYLAPNCLRDVTYLNISDKHFPGD